MKTDPGSANFRQFADVTAVIEDWDWLGDKPKHHLLVVAFVLEKSSGKSLSSITGFFCALQSLAWCVPCCKDSYFKFQQYEVVFGHSRTKDTEKQTLTNKEQGEYATPLEFDKNGRLIQALCQKLGLDDTNYRLKSKTAFNNYRKIWQNYAVYRMITNGNFVLRPQSLYDVRRHMPRAALKDEE